MSITAEAILEVLDRQWASDWPDFETISELEYHAMRLVALRDASDWGLVLATLSGSFLDDDEALGAGVRLKIYGPSVPAHAINVPAKLPLGLTATDHAPDDLALDGVIAEGPAGALTFSPALVERLDLRPGKVCNADHTSERPADLLLLRGYHTVHPGSLFGPLERLTRALSATPDDVLLVCDAFEHVRAPGHDPAGEATPPSASRCFRSLAEALAHRDAQRFAPGPSNLDFRRWARHDDRALARR